jgi:hypothetical protein
MACRYRQVSRVERGVLRTYEDDTRTTVPIRVLSTNMVLRGIATPAQLQWPKRSKKELPIVLINRSSTSLLDSNKVKSREYFKANG